ncbi:Spy/CpxP family protein refolding chaperone [Bradyrhizobium erythrophlei]|uniref:LTXXQ motif family protein n=1 Tax=Bradyrhizobium erythrophlei TaxID=1437360 RepID=A0A1H5I8A6_9BRAD|nr:Spy/CpxP family protein refolding chaperone [Bradyrhizobium erythrophlei]SEE36463.1 LTXXQ motif family protein [Bradyrhizobium erythrophlei]
MLRAARCRHTVLALATILAVAASAALLAGSADAARGGGGGHGGGGHGGGGGGFHGGGGGFHGGGGGFHGGGGGFHGGGFHGGGFHAGGARGGGFHTIHPAARAGTRLGGGSGARHNQFRPAAHAARVAPSVAAGRHAASPAAMRHNASAVGHALASHQVRAAMQRPGGLRNPMARAAITTAAAGAAMGGVGWWRHPNGGYGWVGPIFWPYAYYDLYDYAWWGGGYDPYFWDYGYGDLYAGLFGPYDYDTLSGYAYYLPGYAGPRPPATGRSRATAQTTTLADMCGSDRSDIAGFPIEQFRSAIQPNAEQSTALDELASASQKASATILNSCPKDVPLTAPSRLVAMQQRLQAMRDAVGILQPALERFYGLLSDDQKAKVTALVADQHRGQHGATADNGNCNTAQPAAIAWPGDIIERNVKPTDAQRASLDALRDAATKAEDTLKSSCPPTDARTPPARLAAVGARLDSMLQAIGTVRPAVDTFYSALSDEQKAAFDAVGPERDGGRSAMAAAGGDEPPRSRHRRHHRHGPNVGGMIFRMIGL